VPNLIKEGYLKGYLMRSKKVSITLEKVEINIDDIVKYHGYLYVCREMAFRAAKFGISELWGSDNS